MFTSVYFVVVDVNRPLLFWVDGWKLLLIDDGLLLLLLGFFEGVVDVGKIMGFLG